MGKFNDFFKEFNRNYEDLKNLINNHTGILTGVGIGFTLVGTVLACKATLKVNQASEDHCKLIEDTKANCAEAQMTEKETKKEVARAYKHICCDYVKKYLPAVGMTAAGIGLIIKAHNIEVAKYDGLMSAYISLETLFNKYRESVNARYGEEVEKDIYNEAYMKRADEYHDDPDAPFVDGSYMLFNDRCGDYQKGNPQANEFVIRNVQNNMVSKYKSGRRVYANEVARAFFHEEFADGWKWCWYLGCTPEPNFLVNKEFQPEFMRGICYDGMTEPIAKIYFNGMVRVEQTYKAEVRNSEFADGGIMGGKFGKEPVIIG